MSKGFVTVDQAKANQRIDGNDDDALVGLLLDAAESHVCAYLNRAVFATQEEADAAVEAGIENGIVVTPDICVAVLITFGFFYENREDIGRGAASAIPINAHRLLDMYRLRPGV